MMAVFNGTIPLSALEDDSPPRLSGSWPKSAARRIRSLDPAQQWDEFEEDKSEPWIFFRYTASSALRSPPLRSVKRRIKLTYVQYGARRTLIANGLLAVSPLTDDLDGVNLDVLGAILGAYDDDPAFAAKLNPPIMHPPDFTAEDAAAERETTKKVAAERGLALQEAAEREARAWKQLEEQQQREKSAEQEKYQGRAHDGRYCKKDTGGRSRTEHEEERRRRKEVERQVWRETEPFAKRKKEEKAKRLETGTESVSVSAFHQIEQGHEWDRVRPQIPGQNEGEDTTANQARFRPDMVEVYQRRAAQAAIPRLQHRVKGVSGDSSRRRRKEERYRCDSSFAAPEEESKGREAQEGEGPGPVLNYGEIGYGRSREDDAQPGPSRDVDGGPHRGRIEQARRRASESGKRQLDRENHPARGHHKSFADRIDQPFKVPTKRPVVDDEGQQEEHSGESLSYGRYDGFQQDRHSPSREYNRVESESRSRTDPRQLHNMQRHRHDQYRYHRPDHQSSDAHRHPPRQQRQGREREATEDARDGRRRRHQNFKRSREMWEKPHKSARTPQDYLRKMQADSRAESRARWASVYRQQRLSERDGILYGEVTEDKVDRWGYDDGAGRERSRDRSYAIDRSESSRMAIRANECVIKEKEKEKICSRTGRTGI